MERIVDPFLQDHLVYYGPLTTKTSFGSKKINVFSDHGLRNMSEWSIVQISDPDRLYVLISVPNDVIPYLMQNDIENAVNSSFINAWIKRDPVVFGICVVGFLVLCFRAVFK